VVCGLVWFQEWVLKRLVFESDWIVCSKYDDHSRLNDQHILRDRLMNMRILHFGDEYNVRMNSKRYEECGYGLDLDLVSIL
jgi:hypothetical protein